MYYLYILRCADRSLYTGITTDLNRRIGEHGSAKRGAKYTRSRLPVTLVYAKKFKTRSAALKQELKIKALSRPEKLKLIKNPK